MDKRKAIEERVKRLLNRWKKQGMTDAWGDMSYGNPESIDDGGYGDPHEPPEDTRPDFVRQDEYGWQRLDKL